MVLMARIASAVRADDAPQPIVGLLVDVDRDARAHQACIVGLCDELRREPSSSRGHGHVHPALANGADDVEPVVAQVRLSTDERDLLHAEPGYLIGEIECLARGELVGALLACARATVPARQIAGQRELPDRVDGSVLEIDAAHGVGERQVAAPARRDRGDGEATLRPRPNELTRSRIGGERVEVLHAGCGSSNRASVQSSEIPATPARTPMIATTGSMPDRPTVPLPISAHAARARGRRALSTATATKITMPRLVGVPLELEPCRRSS